MVEVKEGKAYDKSVYGVKDGTYYTVDEWCAIYNLKEDTVRKWKQRGHIRTVFMYGKQYISSEELPHEGKNGRPRKQKLSQK